MAPKYQVLARAYRPQRFADVVGQEPVLRTLRHALERGHLAHAYLFTGPRGVGKTTLARLFAKAINCANPGADREPCNSCASCIDTTASQSLDVIEIDGASNRGIDDIRQINETVGFAPSHGKYKIYIIDEVHMLTKEAFNALLKTLEEPPARAMFFFATTEPHKVLPTVISRCQRFDLGRLPRGLIVERLEKIARDLARAATSEALELIADAADGSMRDAQSLFDQILCFAEGAVEATAVESMLGLAPQEKLFELDHAFHEGRLGFAFELVEQLFVQGKEFGHFLDQLIQHYRHLTLVKTLGANALHLMPTLVARYETAARGYTQAQCLAILDLLLKAEGIMAKSVAPRVTLEMTLLQVLRTRHRVPVEVLVRKLSEIEHALQGGGVAPVAPPPAASEPVVEAVAPLPPSPPEPAPAPEPVAVSAPPVAAAPVVEPAALKPTPLNPYKQIQESVPPPSSSKHQSHYDTLVRFTAVELEGTVKS